MVQEKIDIREMKELVYTHCRPESLLRQVILIDDDFISRDQYIGRAMLWVKLARIEHRYR